ncbi:MAG TPA: DoxX family protein [Chitinophaga sp.]|uniref:DoxX family protein n=1 Tax=Chitinophaga sp. TaxID=1869181 RepID=UPI002B5CEC16|nr:DoxX family protein [Chitinophaga sp.]HVI48772.1 DoxX family protein [Chitinophaga sp.]
MIVIRRFQVRSAPWHFFHRGRWAPIVTTAGIVLYHLLSVALAMAFTGAFITRIFGSDAIIRSMDGWDFPLWLRFPAAWFEMLMSLGLLVPAYRCITVYGVYAWAGVTIISHLIAGDNIMAGIHLLVACIASVIQLLEERIISREAV